MVNLIQFFFFTYLFFLYKRNDIYVGQGLVLGCILCQQSYTSIEKNKTIIDKD